MALRLHSGFGLQGRSFCPSCGKTLSPFELIPILSFLALRGRCKNCKAKISLQYPLVELWTAIVFASIYYKFGLSIHALILTAVFSIYTVILIYDFRHKIIPDPLVYASIFLSLLVPLFVVDYTLFDWLVGPILFSFLGLIWLLSKGRALGFGDAKLALSMGLLLGGVGALSAMALSFWIATAVTVPLMLFSKKNITMKSEIPFAPFMVMGALVSLYFGFDLFSIYTLTS